MIRSFITAITAVLSFWVTVSFANNIELGTIAPDFTLTDINDKEHKLSAYLGKVILIVWSSIGTKDDNKRFREAIYKKYPDEDFSGKGTLVYINVFDLTDKPFYASMSLVKKTMKREMKKREGQVTYRHLFLPDYEGKFRKLYQHPNEKNIHLYVIDGKGVIKYHYSVELSQKEADKDELSQKEVEKADEIIMQLLKALSEH